MIGKALSTLEITPLPERNVLPIRMLSFDIAPFVLHPTAHQTQRRSTMFAFGVWVWGLGLGGLGVCENWPLENLHGPDPFFLAIADGKSPARIFFRLLDGTAA